jgi:hypothetical protein
MSSQDPMSVADCDPESLVGQMLVHRTTNYALEAKAVEPGPHGPELRLESEYRRLTVPVRDLRALRRLVDSNHATRLERLITHGASVIGDPELDLRMHILGTPEQAAAAVATLMDRVAGGDPGAESDLRFMELKLLGELAAVRGRNARAYSELLRSQRESTPLSERTLTIDGPVMPPVPDVVVGIHLPRAVGWHSVATPISALRWGYGDGAWSDGKFDHQGQLLGAEGEWFFSMHDRGGGEIDWLVFARGTPFEFALRGAQAVDVSTGSPIDLEVHASMHSNTGLLVFMGDAPDDAPKAVSHRVTVGRIAVWRFGVAAGLGLPGPFEIYSARGNGVVAWAVRLEPSP